MKKLIIIKVHRNTNQEITSVRVQVLDCYDNLILETVIPIELFLDKKGIEVGRKIFLTSNY